MDAMWVEVWPKLVGIGNALSRWFDAHFINVVVILVAAWLVRKFGSQVIARVIHRTIRPDLYPSKADREKRIRTLNSLISAVARVGVYLVAAMLIVGELNPAYTTALFASAGLISVAVGFGAKDLIKDFMSGIFIISENQYRVGDVVEISGVTGVVEDITIRTTVLRDLDGNVHHVPNGVITVTTNKTLGYSSLQEDIVVGYDTDIAKLEHIINHLGEELAADVKLKNKIIEPPRLLRVDGYGENGMIVKILGKTVPGEQWLVKGEFYRRLKPALDKNHIDLPFQHIVLVDKKSRS